MERIAEVWSPELDAAWCFGKGLVTVLDMRLLVQWQWAFQQ